MLLADSRTQRERIDKLIKHLSEFKGQRETEAQEKRAGLERQLAQLLQIHFGYSEELVGYIRKMFSPEETVDFMEMMDQPRPTTIRMNTLKTNRT